MNFIYQICVLLLLSGIFTNCTRAKEGEFDEDDAPDILVKGNSLEDLDKQDQVFIVDGIVVNAVNNRQLEYTDGHFRLVKEKTFKMEYDNQSKEWKKVAL